MNLATFTEFLNYCRSLRGETLHTDARNKPFTVLVDGNNLWFVPVSSGKQRKANPQEIEEVLSLYIKTGCSTPGSYHDFSFQSSYILAVANRYKSNST